VFGSPPYEAARTYGIGFNLRGQAWVDWMVGVYRAALRVAPLVCFVVEGQTRKYSYSGTPFLLAADLIRNGITLRKPPVFHRHGVPGSGGPDWLRNDYELIICATPGGKLPWSDNTACGHPPKWAPGGEMSNRLSSGTRRNQWGNNHSPTLTSNGRKSMPLRKSNALHKMHTEHLPNGSMEIQSYAPPALANPGNTIKCNVGGGQMGHKLAHENEAPFPLSLAEFFVKSFCPPGGTVCDPFCGSGTTGHAAVLHGRKFVGSDVRESQVWLTKLRMQEVLGEINAEPTRLRNDGTPASREFAPLAG
jgi:hypothetical protein